MVRTLLIFNPEDSEGASEDQGPLLAWVAEILHGSLAPYGVESAHTRLSCEGNSNGTAVFTVKAMFAVPAIRAASDKMRKKVAKDMAEDMKKGFAASHSPLVFYYGTPKPRVYKVGKSLAQKAEEKRLAAAKKVRTRGNVRLSVGVFPPRRCGPWQMAGHS